VALILAVDPGGRQAPALERLARELSGHEFFAADSCAVACTFVERRVPDLVLLPVLLPEKEKTELMSRLHAASDRVRTLTIPLLAVDGQTPAAGESRQPGGRRKQADRPSIDPRVFADQIRQYLAAASQSTPEPGREVEPSIAPDGTAADRRTHVIAAAMAATKWIRARRATWADSPGFDMDLTYIPPVALSGPEPPPALAAAAPSAASAGWDVTAVAEPTSSGTPEKEPDRSPLGLSAGAPTRSVWDVVAPWLPRAAALAVVIAVAVGGRAYWPELRATLTNGTVVLESVPPGSDVLIDGRPAGTAPVTVQLAAGPHTVEFRNGDSSRTREIIVVARDRRVERMDWIAKPTGSLQASSEPTGARVLIDGELRGTTPVTVDGLSVGTHTVAFESVAGSVQRRVTIAADETASLTELIFPGWLTVFSPFEVQITEANRVLQLDERYQVMLPPGPHELRLQNRALGYDEVRRVDLKPAEKATLSIVPPKTTITVTATETAGVWVDDLPAGGTPLTDWPVNLGSHSVMVRTPAGAERRFTLTATVKGVRLDVDFAKPQP
jgi:hypothetical protein